MSQILNPRGTISVSRTKSKEVVNKVFGRDLEVLLTEQNQTIPFVVQDATKWLEKHVTEEGLFRLSGQQPSIERIKLLYEKDALLRMDFGNESPHNITGLMKVYFRELPSPLLTFRFYETFIKVQKNSDHEARLKNLRLLVWGLPLANRNLLLYLMKFLNTVAKFSDKNKMIPSNLATCWAPNLLKSQDESVKEAMINMEHVNSIVTTLIENVDFMLVERKRNATMSVKQMIPPPTSSKKAIEVKVQVQYPEMYGFLMKQGGSFKSWKKRWFVLKDLVMAYYKHPKDAAPIGNIPLPSYLASKADGEVSKPFPFKLAHRGPCRNWYFSAPTSEERDRWIKAIQDTAEFLDAAIQSENSLKRSASNSSQETSPKVERVETEVQHPEIQDSDSSDEDEKQNGNQPSPKWGTPSEISVLDQANGTVHDTLKIVENIPLSIEDDVPFITEYPPEPDLELVVARDEPPSQVSDEFTKELDHEIPKESETPTETRAPEESHHDSSNDNINDITSPVETPQEQKNISAEAPIVEEKATTEESRKQKEVEPFQTRQKRAQTTPN